MDYENGFHLPNPIILLDTLAAAVDTDSSFAKRQNFTWARTLGQHWGKYHGSISKGQSSSRWMLSYKWWNAMSPALLLPPLQSYPVCPCTQIDLPQLKLVTCLSKAFLKPNGEWNTFRFLSHFGWSFPLMVLPLTLHPPYFYTGYRRCVLTLPMVFAAPCTGHFLYSFCLAHKGVFVLGWSEQVHSTVMTTSNDQNHSIVSSVNQQHKPPGKEQEHPTAPGPAQ